MYKTPPRGSKKKFEICRLMLINESNYYSIPP
jgi:hypothetical protein